MPVLLAALSKALVCGSCLAGIVGSNPAGGHGWFVVNVCCAGRGLWGELITRTEESYRLWRVVCGQET
jgi:hypothetical protein